MWVGPAGGGDPADLHVLAASFFAAPEWVVALVLWFATVVGMWCATSVPRCQQRLDPLIPSPPDHRNRDRDEAEGEGHGAGQDARGWGGARRERSGPDYSDHWKLRDELRTQMATGQENLSKELAAIRDRLTKIETEVGVVQKIAYGLVALVLSGFVASILRLLSAAGGAGAAVP